MRMGDTTIRLTRLFIVLILVILVVFLGGPIAGQLWRGVEPDPGCYDSDGHDVLERGFVHVLEKDLRVYDECASREGLLYEGVCLEGRPATLIVSCADDYGMDCRTGACRPPLADGISRQAESLAA